MSVAQEFMVESPAKQAASAQRAAPAAFAATIFLSAFLLFQIQLLISKQILPWYGGAAAVWNTCVVVFQALLLCGYAYSHFLVTRCDPRRQSRIHSLVVFTSIAILAMQVLIWHRPILPAEAFKPIGSAHPVGSILVVLCISVAGPFFVLSTTGPLVQSWLSLSGEASPYRLYATSNAGSLLGLASYPFFLEWMFHLKTQAWIWTISYLGFACGIVLLATRISRLSPAPSIDHKWIGRAGPFSGRKFLLWAGLSACPSAMMLAATSQISSDVPPMPFLWMLPLMLYLLTLMICFDNDRWFRRRIFYPLHFAAITAVVLFNVLVKTSGFQVVIGLYCLVVFTTGMVAHGELARSKPTSSELTSFYLAMAAGGVLGGGFVGLVAPVVFQDLHEFRITLVATLLLVAIAFLRDSCRTRFQRGSWAVVTGLVLATGLVLGATVRGGFHGSGTRVLPYAAAVFTASVVILVASSRSGWRSFLGDPKLLFVYGSYSLFVAAIGVGFTSHFPIKNGQVLLTERDFFGVKRVAKDDATIIMTHGSTLHGLEYTDPARRDEPTFYYSNDSGVALLLRDFPRDHDQGLRIGLVGLGVGTLASYAKSGDVYRFYEIDPQVVRLARGQNSYFHFLEDSRAELEFVEGDARISLEKEARNGDRQQFDVLVLDAFSGDTVPMHLLTREAMQDYLQHLRGVRSVIAVHISNRYIDLKPVLTALAQSDRLQIAYLPARDSHWILLSQSNDVLAITEIKQATFNSFLDQKGVLWTDDYSNLLPLM
jgi:hypothetical protein